MNTIIKKIFGFISNEDRPLLTVQEQLAFVAQNSCFVVKRAMRRQMFYSEVICKMFAMTEEKNGRKFAKMLTYYLEKYGLNDEIKLFLLKSNVLENKLIALYRQKVVDAYGVRLDLKNGTLTATCEEVLEILEYKDINIRMFFYKSKNLFEMLWFVSDIKEQKRVASWDFVVPYSDILGSERVFDDMAYFAEPMLTDDEYCEMISKVFPSYAEQSSVLASGNELWTETLKIVIEKTAEVWNKYLGPFDDSLLIPELKKNV